MSYRYKSAVEAEQEIARICYEMHETGFPFDYDSAKKLYSEVSDRIAEIDALSEADFPPKIKRTQLKTKVREDIIPFNPNSPKQIIDRLDEFGWKPTDKTHTGQWKITERNLSTLSPAAPEGARRLVERLLLRTRLSTLDQWFGGYNPSTGRIHGKFTGIGTWTHRMSHTNPNMANIATEKSIKYKSPELAKLAMYYGKLFRSLWVAGEGNVLVGTDADGIQLRIFAHYINDPQFTEALVNGNKDNGTDAHSVNARILGCDRDTAKTFIYAFLLGAGDRKLAEILGTAVIEGRQRKEAFIAAYPGLAQLKRSVIPADARRGYFEALDGRYIVIAGDTQRDREHLALSGYLQSGEAIVMKHANILWRQNARARDIDYWQVNFIHDEWQTIVSKYGDDGCTLGALQEASISEVGQRLGCRCPLRGNYRIGENWYETH